MSRFGRVIGQSSNMARSPRTISSAPHHRRRSAASLPTLLDITNVADHLGVDVRHVRRLVAEGRIPYVKWGHLLRFDPDELAAWIDASRTHTQRF